MSGLFGDLDPPPKKKVVDRMLKKPSREQLLSNMVRGSGSDFSSVEIKKKHAKQDRGNIDPPINYIDDEQ